MNVKPTITRIFVACALTLLGSLYAPDTPIASADESITVFAASSMTDVLTSLAKDYQRTHPGLTIRFSFLASSALATQINHDAPADLFISASLADIQKVKARISTITPFLTNRVVIGVAKNSPIRKSRDLNGANVKWIQCLHTAPCGVTADSALAAEQSIKSRPVSLEANAAAVVAKVLAGEADAGIMYHTDIMAHFKQLRAIGFRSQAAALTIYALGVLDSSNQAESTEQFKAFLLSVKSLTYLNHRGFGLLTK